MTETRATLDADTAQRLTEFARACKAAIRAVSLYPGGHPAIASTLGRLRELTAAMTATGPYAVEIRPHTLCVQGAEPVKPDAAIVELSDLLRRQLVGRLTLNPGLDADSWRTLLMLLGRPVEDVRADGGIAALWATAGGPSLEIVEIDYAEVLREKEGDALADRLVEAALTGAELELDDSGLRALLEIVGDPARLAYLMRQLEARTENRAGSVRVGAFLKLLRGLAEYVGRRQPEELDATLTRMGHAAGRLSAEGMLELLVRRQQPEAQANGVDVITAVVNRMSDEAVATFVSSSVIAERGATDRLAQAFHALVPEQDRQRQLLALAQSDVAASEFGQESAFDEMWQRIEAMLTSYSDDKFVSDAYARELSSAREKAVDVEAASDDPPERVQTWLATVSDAALRQLDLLLLMDLLRVEQDAARWRDVADTVMVHAEDLVRVDYFDQAWQLAELVAAEGERLPDRASAARAALERLGRGAMLKQAAKHLRTSDDGAADRFKRLCHAAGTSMIPALAEALSAEQDARARRRLRDVLVEFGSAGRETVQQLMTAPNWEVRRTAAFLLREFGGSEGLRELQPLLTDSEPLVQREAIQALMLNGSDTAAQILLSALTVATGRPRQALAAELTAVRDERAGPIFCYLIRHLDPNTAAYIGSIEALGAMDAAGAAEALLEALRRGTWRAPFRTRRLRAAAAQALRRIGSADATAALRAAAAAGPRGSRAVARAALKQAGRA